MQIEKLPSSGINLPFWGCCNTTSVTTSSRHFRNRAVQEHWNIKGPSNIVEMKEKLRPDNNFIITTDGKSSLPSSIKYSFLSLKDTMSQPSHSSTSTPTASPVPTERNLDLDLSLFPGKFLMTDDAVEQECHSQEQSDDSPWWRWEIVNILYAIFLRSR